jgi:hypothetical protein
MNRGTIRAKAKRADNTGSVYFVTSENRWKADALSAVEGLSREEAGMRPYANWKAQQRLDRLESILCALEQEGEVLRGRGENHVLDVRYL